MKQLLLSISLFLGLSSNAQTPTLTQSNHAPMDGYTYVAFDCDTANTGYLPGNAGNGTLWNFTALSVKTTSNTFTSSSYTGTTYAPANYSLSSTSSNNTFYQSDPNFLKLIAANADINGLSVTLTYTAPAVLANYPMTFSTNISTATSGTINPTGTFIGDCDVHYDAVGSLMLPGRTFGNVARVNTVQTYTYSSPGFFNGSVRTETYDYYTIDKSRVPLLSITSSTLSHNQILPTPSTTNQKDKFITILKDYQYVGVKEIANNDIKVSVFPNPAVNVINISTESKEASSVRLIDITGKVILVESIENGNAKLNTSNFSSGTYLYQVLDKQNMILTSGKVSINK